MLGTTAQRPTAGPHATTPVPVPQANRSIRMWRSRRDDRRSRGSATASQCTPSGGRRDHRRACHRGTISPAIAAAPPAQRRAETFGRQLTRINAPAALCWPLQHRLDATTPPRCNAASATDASPQTEAPECGGRAGTIDAARPPPSPCTPSAAVITAGLTTVARSARCHRCARTRPAQRRPKPSGRRLPPHQRPQRLAVGDVHLDAGAVEVALDGADRHGEAVGDLAVGQARGDEVRDFAFAGGEG
ncbi:hypothetical protein APR11_001705 [Nocardia amikacinitolerans]|nr:hypothetical protein [Nocardia amikacinitolerans]